MQPGQDYEDLISYIKGLGSWAKPLESLWFVNTDETCSVVRDGAKQYMDDNDKIFVAKWSPESGWSSRNLSTKVTDWLHNQE